MKRMRSWHACFPGGLLAPGPESAVNLAASSENLQATAGGAGGLTSPPVLHSDSNLQESTQILRSARGGARQRAADAYRPYRPLAVGAPPLSPWQGQKARAERTSAKGAGLPPPRAPTLVSNNVDNEQAPETRGSSQDSPLAASASGGVTLDENIMDALQAWDAWPAFIKDTFNPAATLTEKRRIDQKALAASQAPEELKPCVGPFLRRAQALYGKHGKTRGKIHTVDPSNRSKSFCGWEFTGFADSDGYILSTTPDDSEIGESNGTLICSVCAKREEQLSL